MENVQTDYRAIIRRGGFRLTPQRQIILEALRALHGHCTPENVYDQVQTQTTVINRATVYRTLEFFVEIGLVTVAQVKDNQTVYELVQGTPHHHLVCQRCDHVEQIDHTHVASLFAALQQHFSFQVRTDHLILFGLCQACRPVEPVPPQAGQACSSTDSGCKALVGS